VTARLLETYDVLMVLAPLIEARPWQSENGGKLRRFVQGQWNLVGEAEARKMHRCEAQAWLAVYNLLVDASVRSKYALTSFRRNQLLRLRGFLNEATVDQIPVLTELQRAMDELQLMDSSQVQSQKPAYVLEQLPELRDMLSRGVIWAEVAAAQLKDALNDSDEDKRKQAPPRLAPCRAVRGCQLRPVYNLYTVLCCCSALALLLLCSALCSALGCSPVRSGCCHPTYPGGGARVDVRHGGHRLAPRRRHPSSAQARLLCRAHAAGRRGQ
jgi:hypothetical protein